MEGVSHAAPMIFPEPVKEPLLFCHTQQPAIFVRTP